VLVSAAFPGPPGTAACAALGHALAERMLAARFGASLVDHRTWLLADDAELCAGAAHEAASLAGTLKLGRLAVLAHLPPGSSAPLAAFTAYGWSVRRVTTETEIEAAISAAHRAQKPTLIACLGAAPPPAAAPHPQASGARRAWLKRLRRHVNAEAFQLALSGRPPPQWLDLLAAPAPTTPAGPAEAVRAALARLAPAWLELAGLPASAAAFLPPVAPGQFGGRTFDWGTRTAATAGALLGMAQHGGIVPVGVFALAAAEPAAPAIRAAAAEGTRVVLLLLEPGASQLASWRAIANLTLHQPADAAEALDCLSLALRHTAGPSAIVLSDRAAPALPAPPPDTRPHPASRGGYVLIAPEKPLLSLLAAGPDLHRALSAHHHLAQSGIAASVVSLPCWALFAAQNPAYRAATLGTAPRFALDSAQDMAWYQHLRPADHLLNTAAVSDPAAIAAAVQKKAGGSAPWTPAGEPPGA
jgi:transketolase